MAGPALDRRGLAAAVLIVVTVSAAAWLAAGAAGRRVQASRLPALADLAGLPASAQDAIREADVAARNAPSAASAGALGIAYHAAQRPAPALAAFAVAEAMAPADWRWPYHRALVLDERHEAGTEAALERTVALYPAHGLAWYRLAEWRFKQGRLDEAAAAYTRAIEAPAAAPFLPPGVTARSSTPLAAWARTGLARIALEHGDAAGARTLVDAVLGSQPAFGPARALRRQLARDPGDAAGGAIAPFVPPADPTLDAIVASARHSDVLLKHAGLAARGGDTAWREFLVARALTLNPDDLNVLMEAATTAMAAHRDSDALALLRRHEALAPGDHHGLVQQGRVLTDLGRFAEAEAVLRRATAVRDAAAEYNLGVALDAQDRWDEARTRYERALAIDPYHVRAMNNLGVGLDRRGRSADALQWFARAIAIDGDAAEFHVNLGSALIHAGRFAEATRALTEAVGLDPRDANAYNNLGIAWAQQGELGRARDALTRAVEIDPRHADARRNLAQVSAALSAR